MTIDELQSSLLIHKQQMSFHIGEEHALRYLMLIIPEEGAKVVKSSRGRGRELGKQSFNKSIMGAINLQHSQAWALSMGISSN